MMPFHETMVTSGRKQIGIQPLCLVLPRVYPALRLSSISVTEGCIGAPRAQVRGLGGYGGPLPMKRRPQSAPARIFKHILILFQAKVLVIVLVQGGDIGKSAKFCLTPSPFGSCSDDACQGPPIFSDRQASPLARGRNARNKLYVRKNARILPLGKVDSLSVCLKHT